MIKILSRWNHHPRNYCNLMSIFFWYKTLLTRGHHHENKISDWQLILSQSKANGGFHQDENLPQQNWGWPKNTWFQRRLSRSADDLELGHVDLKEGKLECMERSIP